MVDYRSDGDPLRKKKLNVKEANSRSNVTNTHAIARNSA
jgi:hypothetical protein